MVYLVYMDVDGLGFYSEEKYTSYVLNFQSIEAKSREILPRHSRCTTILENNLLMCKCLIQIDEWCQEKPKNKWDDITTQFATIHQKSKHCVNEDSVCDDLVPSLTLVFNCLYWTWINPKGISRNKNSVLESFGLVRKCLHFLLDFFQYSCVNDSFNDIYLSVLNLMNLSSAHLFKLPGVHNKLLLEIYLIAGHIILESTLNRHDEDLLQKFASFVKSLRKWKHLFLCQSNVLACASKLSIFKFGLSRLNATTQAHDIELVLSGLGNLECLCLLRLKYSSSQATLDHLDYKSDISCFSGYLKAYVHMLLGDNELSVLFICELLKQQMPEILLHQCHLLKGIVLSRIKEYDKAQKEFLDVESLNPKVLPNMIVIFHMALNYESWLKNSSSSTISNAYFCSLKLVTRALHEVISKPELSVCANYISKVIKILEPSPHAVLGRALYMLARYYESRGEYKNSARTFLRLFRMPSERKKPQFTIQTSLEPNPPTQTVLHETITVLVQSKEFENAKIVCNIALTNADYQSSVDELIPLMFLAIIEGKLGNKTQEIKFLRKCSAIALKAHCMGDEINDMPASTFKKLVARVYLQKALYFANIRNFSAATINFKMALGANILDKRTLYQYLRFLIRSRDGNRFELWMSHKQTFNNKEECYSNLALKYLLESNITDVKIETISAHFWASEVFNDF